MYCLANICYVCLKKKNKPISDINSSPVNKDIILIIGYLPFDLTWVKTKQIILICEECCLRLREFYQFHAMCLKNSALMQGYLDKVNTASTSSADNEAELLVYLNSKHDDINERKCEMKLEDEEIYTFERGPIIEESEDVFVNVDDSFVKEEDTWKREEVEDMEESPMDNYFTENSDKEPDSEISVYSSTHDTDTDSDSSGFTHKQVHATNKREIDEAAKKSYTCSTCSKSFIKKTVLERHTRVHTGEKPFKCSTCEKCFNQKTNLTTHMRVHTSENPFKCSRCEKSFRKKFCLVRHMRLHTGEKPFKCTRCERCFGQKFDLINHMRVHTGEKPFKCTRCEKYFKRQSYLAIHMRTHTGEKPHKCSRCEKCFGQKAILLRHMRMHTGEKPHQCSICKKCFSLKFNLVSHMRTHTGT